MKKTLVALAALASISAFAQSTVTMYGIAEVGYGTSKTDGYTNTTGTSTLAKNVKSAGLVNGTGNGRLGIKSSEDLGGGLSANFVAEQQMLIADGTAIDQTVANSNTTKQQTGIFGGKTRQTTLGLAGGFGALNLGYKKGTEQDLNDMFNLGFQEAAAGNEFHTDKRLGRAKGIYYTAPKFGDVTVNVQHTTGKADYADATKQGTSEIDAKLTGISAVYANGPLTAGFNRTTGKITLGSDAAAAATATGSTAAIDLFNTGTQLIAGEENKYKSTTLGAKYAFSAVTLSAQAGSRQYGSTAEANLAKATWRQIGANMPIGNVELIAVYGQSVRKGVDGLQDDKIKGYQAGAKYNFSKRTVGYTYVGKSKTTSTEDAPNATRDNPVVKTFNLGMMHSF